MGRRFVEIIKRREEYRRKIIENARRWASSLDFKSTAILIGSYARGDYNLWSDIDILLITDELSGNVLKRMERLDNPSGFQIIPITRAEFNELLQKRNILAKEALTNGVILRDDLLISKMKKSSK